MAESKAIFVPIRLSNASLVALTGDDQAVMSRIAELEAALDEITTSAYPIDGAMCVPVGAWENAMRLVKPTQHP